MVHLKNVEHKNAIARREYQTAKTYFSKSQKIKAIRLKVLMSKST